MYFFICFRECSQFLQSIFSVVLPDCSHCWSARHWGQKSNVPWSRVTIIAVSLCAGSLLKVLIQVTLKSSLEVEKKSNCKCVAHKITFISLKYTQGRFFIPLFFIVRHPVSLQRGPGNMLQCLANRPIVRMIGNFITFLKNVLQVQETSLYSKNTLFSHF